MHYNNTVVKLVQKNKLKNDVRNLNSVLLYRHNCNKPASDNLKQMLDLKKPHP